MSAETKIRVVIFAGILATGLGLWSCSEKRESITFGNLPRESSALIYIAENKRIFLQNGLCVAIRNYDTGPAAIDGMLKGEVDIATASEFVVVGKALEKQKISILGTMDRSMPMYLIGRKSRGVNKISDLAGKRVGLARGTIAEFYLGRFLDLHGMNIKDTALVDMPPSKWLDAVSTGDVDAIAAWQPFVNQIQGRFPNETVAWQVQSGQPVFGLILCANDWPAKHPETIRRFWKSLVQAEQYLIRHPDEAKNIVRNSLDYDDAYMAAAWPDYEFFPSLDQSLILAMEDEARWIIRNNSAGGKQVPDFLDYIDTGGLMAVKPKAVNIIRKTEKP